MVAGAGAVGREHSTRAGPPRDVGRTRAGRAGTRAGVAPTVADLAWRDSAGARRAARADVPPREPPSRLDETTAASTTHGECEHDPARGAIRGLGARVVTRARRRRAGAGAESASGRRSSRRAAASASAARERTLRIGRPHRPDAADRQPSGADGEIGGSHCQPEAGRVERGAEGGGPRDEQRPLQHERRARRPAAEGFAAIERPSEMPAKVADDRTAVERELVPARDALASSSARLGRRRSERQRDRSPLDRSSPATGPSGSASMDARGTRKRPASSTTRGGPRAGFTRSRLGANACPHTRATSRNRAECV